MSAFEIAGKEPVPLWIEWRNRSFTDKAQRDVFGYEQCLLLSKVSTTIVLRNYCF